MLETEIADRFSAGAQDYDRLAAVQYQMATEFARWLGTPATCNTTAATMSADGTAGPRYVTELGCGTGFLTEQLSDRFPSADIHACDLSANMLAHCRLRLQSRSKTVSTYLANASDFTAPVPCDWIVSSFCLQWMQDLPATLAFHAMRAPRLSVCLPCAGSFADWKQAHADLGLTPSLWPLPRVNDVVSTLQRLGAERNAQLRFRVVNALEHHDSPMAFARHLRAIGADHAGGRRPNAGLRSVLKALPTPYLASYEVLMADLIHHDNTRASPPTQ